MFTSNQVPSLENVEITELLNRVAFVSHRHSQLSQGRPQRHTRMFILCHLYLHGPIYYGCNNFKHKI